MKSLALKLLMPQVNVTTAPSLEDPARHKELNSDRLIYFDGVNDWVTVNDAPSLDLTACMTLEAWVYPTVNMTHPKTVVLKQRPSGLVYSLQANSDANQPSMAVRIGGSYRTLKGGPWLRQ